MVKVEKLTFNYPTTKALKNISFELHANSITALVGPNGAGKSTLMRCLAGLDAPFEGCITINDINVIENPRQAHCHIGFLQDLFGLYEELTVYQCLYYHAEAQGIAVDVREGRITELSKQLNIEKKLHQTTATLSRGQRQRVAIAQAIIHQPRVLILDEPASGLDPEARHELAELLLYLQKQGMTILVSSHILAELEGYSSHMLILNHGRVIEHCKIGAQAEQLGHIQIKLTKPVPDLEQQLAKLPNVEHTSCENPLAFQISFSGDEVGQQQLLQSMVQQGLPIYGFIEVQHSMQDLYINKVKGEINES